MLVTLPGTVTLISSEQFSNASDPMLVTPLEMMTLLRLVQLSNA